MGCDNNLRELLLNEKSFNPRTRMGCDYALRYYTIIDNGVSIHAPAWGATCRAFRLLLGKAVSIHAPAWGATESITDFILRSLGFNPRTRMGCDLNADYSNSNHQRFNPRTRMGCDITALRGVMMTRRFQSTHPHGVRLRI